MSSLMSSKGNRRTLYCYILPGFILFCIANMIPIVVCLVISLTSWRGGNTFNFVGLENYLILLKDENFWFSFWNNIQLIIYCIIFQIGIAFILSILYSSKVVIMKELHRRVIFLPVILAPIAVGMIWQLIYRSDIGIIASVLTKIGAEGLILKWLDSPVLVIPAITITLIWQYAGQFVIILMAGITNINTSVLEAAEIDGASPFQKAVHITFPLLRPAVYVCMLLCISGCMKIFDIIFIMSGGGPGKASMVTSLYAYDMAFKSQKLGYSSTVAIGIIVLSLAMIQLIKIPTKGGQIND